MNRNIMNRIISSLLVAALMLGTFPSIAFADNAEEVEALSIKGAEAYQEKDYKSAIRHFQAAYDIEAVPNLLFNIAKCHEKLKDWESAIKFYEKFVVAPDAQSDIRESAQAKIKSLQEVVEAEKEQLEKEEEEKRLAEERKNKKKKKKTTSNSEEPIEPAKADRTLAYIVGGGVFGLLASQKQSDFESAETSSARRDAQKSGKTMAIVADSMFIAGAIATTVGIILFATAKPEQPQFTGWVNQNGGGIGFGLSF